MTAAYEKKSVIDDHSICIDVWSDVKTLFKQRVVHKTNILDGAVITHQEL